MLSPLQQRIAELFFTVDESAGFALAGGAALIVRGQIDRETHDLDFFADLRNVKDVGPVAAAVTSACVDAGLDVAVVQSSTTFARLVFTELDTQESMLIDVALDAIDEAPTVTVAGPTLTAKELAANKVLALYGRMEARDFEDTWRLATQIDTDDLLRWAAAKDAGFERSMFADSLTWLDRLPDRRFTLPGDELVEMRNWFARLREALERGDPPPKAD